MGKKTFEFILSASAIGWQNVNKARVGLNAFNKDVKTGNKQLQESRKQAALTTTSFSNLGRTVAGVFTGAAIIYYANKVRQVSDEYQNLNSRLKLVTDGSEDLAMVQDKLFKISQDTGTKYADNAGSYTKLAFALKDVGAQSEETLKITELVNKSLIVNGSSTAESSSFMLQFAQAMGSGVLQGDEFRAMLESNSYFAGLMAKSLGTNIAGLRQMSKEGKLTSDVLRGTFPKMAEEINTAFAKMPATTARAMTALENAFYRIVDDSNKASDGTGTIAASILELAQTIDQNRDGIVSLFTGIISLASKTTVAVANIGQSLAGWAAVGDGRLSIFRFATMDAKELSTWLKQNASEVGLLDAKIAQLKERKKEVASEGYYTPAAIASKKAVLDGINQEISALEKQKLAISKTAMSHDNVSAAAAKSAAEQKNTVLKVTKEMTAAYQKYADEVRKIQNEIANGERSLAAQLRELTRTGMSDVGAWQDRKREAGEYFETSKKALAEAEAALKAGDEVTAAAKFADAKQMADESRAAYAELNKAVESNGQVVISQQTALKTAMSGVKESGELGIEILKRQKDAAIAAGRALDATTGGQLSKDLPEAAKAFGELNTQAEDLGKKSAEFNEAWNKAWDDFLKDGNGAIYDLDTKLSQLTKDRHIKVYVQEVTQKALGGMVGVPGFATGGSPANIWQQFRRLTNPLITSGSGLRDDVPAMLKKYEFVQPSESVRYYGWKFMEMIRRRLLPKPMGFAAGGSPAGSVSLAGAGAGGGNLYFTGDINFAGEVSTASRQTAREQAKMVLDELKKMYARSSK